MRIDGRLEVDVPPVTPVCAGGGPAAPGQQRLVIRVVGTQTAVVSRSCEDARMPNVIIGLLVLWLVLTVLGFAVHALLWLAIVGIVLFLATAVFGWIRRKAG